ncbi:MAG TPA: CHAD domain-containing protein [Acidobacteriota bacterium]|nr:CHAD domain-containing protein [Acidobacteriota bacterium]
MKAPYLQFMFPGWGGREEKKVTEKLASLGFVQGDQETAERLYGDTFDWQLYRQRTTLFLESAGPDRCLLRLITPDSVSSARASSSGHLPVYAHHLPGGPLQNALGNKIGASYIAPVTAVKYRTQFFFCPATGTHLRLSQPALRVAGLDQEQALPMQLQFAAEAESASLRALRRWLEQEGISATHCCEVDSAIRVLGQEPVAFPLAVEAQRAGWQALRVAHRSLLSSFLRHLEGVRDDLDPVFLHALRVITRRVRVVLTQIEPAHKTPPKSELKSDLRWLGEVTGKVRDLDVSLVWLESRGLQSGRPPAVERRVAQLERERRELHRRLCDSLSSAWLSDFLLSWRGQIRAMDWDGSLRDSVDRAVNSNLKKAREDALRVRAAFSPRMLHKLRIRFKKLRYLLDTFDSPMREGPPTDCLRVLKSLQDELGALNDLFAFQTTILKPGDDSGATTRLAAELEIEKKHRRRQVLVAIDQWLTR